LLHFTTESGTTTIPGSTPLHFAAANGHAPIVQILLTCGATPDKSDKNGMTPEALAEVNGHTDVIRVLRVWEHLKLQESESHNSSAGGAGPASDRGDVESLSASTSQLGLDDESERYRYPGSRKGKERAMSFSSHISDAPSSRSQAVFMKKGLEGLPRPRGSRSVSASSMDGREETPPHDEDSGFQVRLSTFNDETEHDTIVSPVNAVTVTSAQSLDGPSASLDSNGDSADPNGLERTPSPASAGSAPSAGEQVDQVSPFIIAPPPPRRLTSASSRRPSLPSIFERAAHPGATFRAAIRRDREPKSRSPPDPPHSPGDETSRRSANSSGSFFRGRVKTNEIPARPHGGRRYVSKHGLVGLFRRGQSPPSRSPSPPERSEPTKIIAPEELDEGIERLKRASLDLDRRESRENSSEIVDLKDEGPRRPPASAPATKTRFFEDLDAPPLPPFNITAYSFKIDEKAPLSTSSSGSDRPRNRPRTGSEVIAPSPLAKEWNHEEDSDSPPRPGVRRSKTETMQGSPSSGQSDSPDPPPPVFTKPRSSTLPSAPGMAGKGPWLHGLGWDDGVDLRKVASGVFRREKEILQQGVEDGEGEDEVFHDVLPDVDDLEGAESLAIPIDGVASGEAPDPKPVDGVIAQAKEATEVGIPHMSSEVEQLGKPSTLSSEIPDRVELEDSPKPSSRESGRDRGASIGSTTTQSSRISTAPGSSLRMSLITDESSSERGSYGQTRSPPDSKRPPHPPRAPSVKSMIDGRQRGISVSSTSTSASGMNFSYMQSGSTPGTSLTPPSTLSVHLTAGFPPVPEHEVAHHPVTRRKFSSRAEAANIVKQNEDDILQLAQLPPSLDSSRSLAAQLAAYGENHAIEQEFAEREAQVTMSDDVESSDNASFFSAEESARSGMSSPLSSERMSQFSGSRKCECIDHASWRQADETAFSSWPAEPSLYRRAAILGALNQQHLRQASGCVSPTHDDTDRHSTRRSILVFGSLSHSATRRYLQRFLAERWTQSAPIRRKFDRSRHRPSSEHIRTYAGRVLPHT